MIPVAVLAALVLGLCGYAGPSSQGAAEEEAASATVSQEADRLPTMTAFQGRSFDLIEEFRYGRKPQSSDPCRKHPADGHKVRFLIAMVPDPFDSHIPYFDHYLAAVQRAVERAGFDLDRFYLPWPNSTQDEAARKQALSSRRFAEEAGIMLFRCDRCENKDLLLLFLVGETPTTGIHKKALRNALDQIAEFERRGMVFESDLRPLQSPGKGDCLGGDGSGRFCGRQQTYMNIRILGPCFSGSAASLDFVLCEWFQQQRGRFDCEFNLVTATATAVNRDRHFSPDHCDGLKIRFSSTSIPEDLALNAFLESQYCRDPRKVILLVEASTAFGRGIPFQREWVAPHYRDRPLGGVRVYRFPFHVSQLRKEAATARTVPKATPSEMPKKSQHFTTIPWEQAEQPRDTVPPLTDMEKPSVELMLRSLFTSIRRDGIEYVGIVATDVMDLVFLARELRRYCPNTILFSFGSDLLYLHSDINVDLQGSLLLTPYPLVGLNQLWTYPHKGDQFRHHFCTGFSMAVYNAAMILLEREEYLLEYGRPLVKPDRKVPRKPSLWLTAVGREGMWPIDLLDYENHQEDVHYLHPSCSHKNDEADKRLIPLLPKDLVHPTMIGFFTFSFFCMLVSWLVCREFPLRKSSRNGNRKKNGRSLGAWLRCFADVHLPEHRTGCRSTILGGCISLLAMYLIVTAIFILPVFLSIAHSSKGFHLCAITQWVVSLIALFALVSMLTAIGCLGGVLWKERPTVRMQGGKGYRPDLLRSTRSMAFAWVSMGVLVLSLVLVGDWIFRALSRPDRGLFLYLRSVFPESGLSPLLPLLLLTTASFLWSMRFVSRIRMNDKMACGGPFFGFNTEPFGNMRKMESRLREVLSVSLIQSLRQFGRPAPWILIAITALPVFVLALRFVPTIEGRAFDLVFGFSFSVVYGAVFLEFLRFVLLWVRLKSLLRLLKWLPLRVACAGFLDRFTGSNAPPQQRLPKMDAATSVPPLNVLKVSVDQACHVFESIPALELPGELPPQLQATREHLLQRLSDLRREAGEARWRYNLAIQAVTEDNQEELWDHGVRCQKALSNVSTILEEILGPLLRSDLPDACGVKITGDKGSSKAGAWTQWTESASDFFILRIYHFLSCILPEFRGLVTFVLTGILLMLFAVGSYPFQPRQSILYFLWFVVLVVVAVTLAIYFRMNRDAVLSIFSGGTPHKIDWGREFTLRVLGVGILPILAFLGVQFPEAVRQVLVWLGLTQAGQP